MCVCVSVRLFVLSEISWTGRRSAAFLTPTWRASPGELHKPLLELIRRTVGEKKALDAFPRLRVDGRIPRKDFQLRSCLRNFRRFDVEGHALHVSEPTHSWSGFKCQNLPVRERVSSSLYNNTGILCVCVSVPSEISWTGRRSAALLTPTWRASPGELHKPLLESIRRTVREKKPLKVFARLRVDGRVRR